MKVLTYTLGPVQANCYILIENNHALIIDPGDSFDIQKLIDQENITIDAIVLTHVHFDHFSGLESLCKNISCDIYCNEKEFDFFMNPYLNASSHFMYPVTYSCQPIAVKEGVIKIGTFEMEAIYCPGHTTGSTVYRYKNLLFTGDVLFKGSIGRCDLETGSFTEMKKSIQKIKEIKENLYILPGHGPLSTLDEEKKENPNF